MSEGADTSNYEKPMMFHGTNLETLPKICSQGFNRSFCGLNATKYGKGVYFALTSAYSDPYCQADSSGLMHMLVCRVLPGEPCQGHRDQLIPDVRVEASNTLYDSTTDMLEYPEPSDDNPAARTNVRKMYVVYHDAQACK